MKQGQKDMNSYPLKFSDLRKIRIIAILVTLCAYAISCDKRHEISDSVRNASAEGSLKTIYFTQIEYSQKYHVFGSLEDLGRVQLIDPSLARGKKSDHQYSLILSKDLQSYECYAHPSMGSKLMSYRLSSDGIIRGGIHNGEEAKPVDPIVWDVNRNGT